MIAIGPSPPPSSLLVAHCSHKNRPLSMMVGECERGNNGKKQQLQVSRRIAKHTPPLTRIGEKARRRLTTSPSSHFAFAAAAAVDSAAPFSPPSLRISTFVRRLANPFLPPPANAHWSRRALLARSSNGASRPAAPFGAKTAESAIAGCAPSPFPFRASSYIPPSLPLAPIDDGRVKKRLGRQARIEGAMRQLWMSLQKFHVNSGLSAPLFCQAEDAAAEAENRRKSALESKLEPWPKKTPT